MISGNLLPLSARPRPPLQSYAHTWTAKHHSTIPITSASVLTVRSALLSFPFAKLPRKLLPVHFLIDAVFHVHRCPRKIFHVQHQPTESWIIIAIFAATMSGFGPSTLIVTGR